MPFDSPAFMRSLRTFDLSVACHERSLRVAGGKRKLSRMEAAGVEPASERPLSPESTCVSPFDWSQPAWKRGENRRPPGPNGVSSPAGSDRPGQPACVHDIQSRRAGPNGVDVAALRQRVRAACSQLRWFHRFYEAMALGMHPATPYPRRNRFAPTVAECAELLLPILSVHARSGLGVVFPPRR